MEMSLAQRIEKEETLHLHNSDMRDSHEYIQTYIQRQTGIIRASEAGDMVFKNKADRKLVAFVFYDSAHPTY